MKGIRMLFFAGIIFSSLFAKGGILKSIVYDFDGADIGQTNLPDGDYRVNDLTYKAVANPVGSSEMLGDRVLEMDLNWNIGNGTFGRGISRFIEFNPSTDIFNFYFYNPTSNSADASFDVAITEDDDGSNTYSINNDDVWIKSVTVSRSAGWQLISIPLSDFTDGNAGGNGIFDAAFTGAQGMLLMVEFRFKKNTTINEVFYLDMICFSDGALPTGATILDLPSQTMAGKCPLGAFEQKTIGDQYLISSDIEGMFPSMPKKIKYVNWFLQFAMDGTTTAKVLPGNEVIILLSGGYRPIITWEPLFQGYDRLDPVQPRLNNIINGDYDFYINSFADKTKSYNDTIIIRFMHEFEGNWYPWSITYNNQDPAKYVSAFRKVVDMFRARGATKVKWMWCLNSDYFPYLSYNWAVPAYPGDNYVDIVATDVYNNHYPTDLPWWKSFRWQTTESYYYLTKYFPNKPLMMCEEGCRERTGTENPTSETKAQWLTQMDKQLRSNYSRIKGLVFFSAQHEFDWRINSSTAALNAMANNTWNDDYYFESTNPPPPPVTCSATGTIVQEVWANISGYSISSIPVNTAPSYTVQLNLFEEPGNAADNYGSRVRGTICPPQTGNYTFWIASDDNSELWLSTDSTPTNKIKIAYVSGWTSSREWTKYPSQQSAPIYLTAGKKYYMESLHKEGMQGDNLSVGWQLPSGIFERPIAGIRLSPYTSTSPPTASCSATGNIAQDVWANISGYSISSIPVTTAPSYTVQLNLFEEPSNVADNYGSRVRGTICTPFTGNYIFWIASDDNSELWLSADSIPNNKTKIAYVSGWTNSREWTKYSSQQSVPIYLVAEKKYYIESLHKEGMQGDNLAVGWQLPNGIMERPIPGSRLSPVISSQPPTSQNLISANSPWKYLDNGSNQGTGWRTISFSDAEWKTGNAELGYGDGGEATVVYYGGSSNNKYITTYFRKSFSVTDALAFSGLELGLVRDDGAVVYLNGTEVYRSNMPSGIIAYNTLASTAISGSDESAWNTASISKASLVTGNNLLAVEIHQNVRTSSDISFNLKLKGISGGKKEDTNALLTNDSVNYSQSNFILYPNPTTGLFTMEYCNYNVKENSLLIEIVNSIGQVIFQKQVMKINGCAKEIIELDKDFPSGIYIMNVLAGNNKENKQIILSGK